MSDPINVRVGPGILYVAPLDTDPPTDLATPWDGDWIELGYTDEGSSFKVDQTFEDVTVAEELDPVRILQTARQISIDFAAAEITARNMSLVWNGGTVVTPSGGVYTITPPATGSYTPVMVGWEADDGLERIVLYRCLQVGSVELAHRKAPAKATLPMSFRATVPDGGGDVCAVLIDADYESGS